MKHLILCCSLNPKSKSRVLADVLKKALDKNGEECAIMDASEFNFPQCDGKECYNHESVKLLGKRILESATITFSAPIYNFDVNAAAKNLMELGGTSWKGKTIAFLCSAGGNKSYMSVMPFANSFMLDFRCIIVPKFVYASDDAFIGEQ
ncbi:MAG: NAD(P)H-dependent oxidoreductase, partial [archaeon]|nr:NAD(P)H-dependent oxidoreductase [archaeon]